MFTRDQTEFSPIKTRAEQVVNCRLEVLGRVKNANNLMNGLSLLHTATLCSPVGLIHSLFVACGGAGVLHFCDGEEGMGIAAARSQFGRDPDCFH